MWQRPATGDLLEACDPSDLGIQLHARCGPLWKQFRHIGRVHEEYLAALQTGRMAFDPKNGTYDGGESKAGLLRYFGELSARHTAAYGPVRRDARIDWFGESTSPDIHLIRLISHETLHHGQLIQSWRALGKSFPESWASWGEH